MAFAIVHTFPGGTEEQYRATLAAVHPTDGTLPNGQLFHFAGPSADGWMVVAIHESRENWEDFRDSSLLPRMAAGVPGGLQGPPAERSFEIISQESA
jgi:hypothetical protein